MKPLIELIEQSKSIIYDFDGVILDSVDVKTGAFAEIYRDCDPSTLKLILKHHKTYEGISRYKKFHYYENFILKSNCNEERIEELAKRFHEIVFNKVVAADYIYGAKEFLIKHSKDKKQFICTGTPEAEILQIVDRLKISTFFDEIYGSPKTKEVIIDIILNNYELESKDILFFGDALTDYNAANNTGCKFIGIKNKKGTHPFPPNTLVINSFKDLENG